MLVISIVVSVGYVYDIIVVAVFYFVNVSVVTYNTVFTVFLLSLFECIHYSLFLCELFLYVVFVNAFNFYCDTVDYLNVVSDYDYIHEFSVLDAVYFYFVSI